MNLVYVMYPVKVGLETNERCGGSYDLHYLHQSMEAFFIFFVIRL